MCVFVCMYVCLHFPGSKMDAGCQKDPDASISDHLSCSCLSQLCDVLVHSRRVRVSGLPRCSTQRSFNVQSLHLCLSISLNPWQWPQGHFGIRLHQLTQPEHTQHDRLSTLLQIFCLLYPLCLKQRSIRILNREQPGEVRVRRFKWKQYADLDNFPACGLFLGAQNDVALLTLRQEMFDNSYFGKRKWKRVRQDE